MSLFNTDAPQLNYTAPERLSQTDNSALGFNKDGSRTGWGDFLSFVPGVGLATTAIAQGNEAGTDAAGKTAGYQKGNWDKLLLEGTIAGGVLGAGALGAGAAGSVAADSAAGGAAGDIASPFTVGADAIQPSTGLADVSSSTAVGAGANAAGGSGGWMDYLKKATNIIKPLTNLTSGADNNNYQTPTRTSLIQNYNG